jgi:hypothetical protein
MIHKAKECDNNPTILTVDSKQYKNKEMKLLPLLLQQGNENQTGGPSQLVSCCSKEHIIKGQLNAQMLFLCMYLISSLFSALRGLFIHRINVEG